MAELNEQGKATIRGGQLVADRDLAAGGTRRVTRPKAAGQSISGGADLVGPAGIEPATNRL